MSCHREVFAQDELPWFHCFPLPIGKVSVTLGFSALATCHEKVPYIFVGERVKNIRSLRFQSGGSNSFTLERPDVSVRPQFLDLKWNFHHLYATQER